jgi:tetratricopeptide (TPR) repeat protein
MRRLNVKLILGLFAGTIFLTAAVVVTHALQAGNISSALLWRAGQAESQGRLKEAARYLKRYLEFAPDDNEERAHLGRLLTDPSLTTTNRGRHRARYVLEQVLTREPERHDLRALLVRLALDSWDLTAAKDQLQRLQKARPGDPEVAGLVAELQEREGHAEQAAQNYRKALKSGKIDFQVRLINLLLTLERRQPGSQAEEVGRLVEAALRQAPSDAGVLLAASDWCAYRNDLKAARRHLDAGLKAHPANPPLHLALATLQAHQGKRGEAMRTVKHGLEVVPLEDRPDLLWALANLHIDGGEFPEARKLAGQIQAAIGPSPTLDYLEGRCLMAQQRWPEAAAALERVRGAARSAPGLLLQVELFLGRCYEQLNEPGHQLAAFSRALALDPTSAAAREGVASAQWALGRADDAVSQYRKLLKLRPGREGQWAGRLELGRLLLASNAQRDPRRWQQVEQELDAAEKEQPGSAEATLLRADLRLAQDQPAQAEKALRDGLAQKPKSVVLWAALATLAERRKDPAGARRILDEAGQKVGDTVELRLARAGFFAARPKKEAVPALAALENGAAKFAGLDQLRLLHGLAEAYYRAGDVAAATRLWQQLAARPEHARDLRLRLLLFDVALQQDDEPAMRRLLEQVKTLDDPDGAVWRYGEAVRLLWLARKGKKDGLDQARTLLETATARRPTWAPALLARAELEELRGRPGEAIARYRQALDKGVRDPRVVRRLVQLLSSQQRYGEAEQVLRDLGQQAPLSGDLQRLAVALSLQNDDVARAEELVRQAGSASSNDFRDQLWLGQVLAAGQRRSAEAEKALRRAVRLADTVPETWVALVRYLAAAGQTEQARAEVEKARVRLKGADAPLALGACYELVGAADRAREQYQAALQARPDEPGVLRSVAAYCLRGGRVADAEPHLRRLFEGKVKASEEEAAWARHTLALALANGGDPRRLPEALALVGLALTAQGDLADGLAPGAAGGREEDLARARALAALNRGSFQARAASLLEEAARQQPLAPDDQLLLARLYLTRGKEDLWWGKARDQLKELAAAHGRNPAYLAFYARALLEHGATQEAEQILDRLEQIEKARQVPAGQAASVELRAQALEKSGRGRQALALLDKCAHAPGAPPDRLLLCAGLQGRLGELAKALDICEQARRSCPPDAVVAAAVAALREARQKERSAEPSASWRQQASRAEAWLREGIKSAGNTTGLRLQLADLLDLAGRGAEAEPIYRDVLKEDDRNPVALNNLAWLLAQQPGKAGEALTFVNRAIALYGAQAELLDTRGVVYVVLGQGGPAVADLRRSVRDSPGPSSYFHLARAHHLAQDTRSALAALNQANAAGLTAEALHPSERGAYRRLVAELQRK